MRTIEYQFRGLPHCHIVFRLCDGPNHSDPNDCKAWIQQHIATTMPIVSELSSEEDKRYAEYVDRYMIHGCRGGANGCLDKDGV